MIIKWYILSSKSKSKIKLCHWLLMGRSKYGKGGTSLRYFDPGVKISWGSKYRLTPDYFDRNKILSGYDLSHYQVPHFIESFLLFCLICVYSWQFSILFWIMYLL